MFYSHKLIFIIGCLMAAPLDAAAQAQPQAPVIIDQTNVGTGGNSLVWASNEKWLATLDTEGGRVRVYDIATERLSRQISVAASDSMTRLIAVPASDHIALSEGSIGIYDVISGAKLITASNSIGCSIDSVEDGEIKGDCPPSKISAFHPNTILHRAWDLATGAQLREETGSRVFMASPAITDGTWLSEMKNPGIRTILKAGMRAGSNRVPGYYSISKFVISDQKSKQVVMEGQGMLAALSQKSHTAVVKTADGLILIQVPTGNRVRTLAAGSTNANAVAYSTVKTVLGGNGYILSDGGSSPSLINAQTGDVQATFADLPALEAAVVSPSGTRVAFLRPAAILVVNLPDTAHRQIIGNQSGAPLPVDAVQKLYESRGPDVNALIVNAKSRAKEQAKQAANDEKDFQKTLPKFNNAKRAQMTEDHRRDQQRSNEERSSNSVPNSSAATATYYAAAKERLAAIWDSYMVFGGPAAMAPEFEFLDSGRVLAVLAADLSWNTWDANTGNLLPFKTVRPEYERFLEITSKNLSATDRTTDVYAFLRDQLLDAVPGSAKAASSPVPPAAVNQLACSSQSGDALVDIKVELDPKKWKTNKHRVASAILRLSNGTHVDLLARSIDFSSLAESNPFEAQGVIKKAHCGLSAGGKYLVLEKLHPDTSKRPHLSVRYKAIEQLEGKQTVDSLELYETSSGKEMCELDGSRNLDAQPGDLMFSPTAHYLVTSQSRQADALDRAYVLHQGAPRPSNIRLWDARSCKKLLDISGQDRRVFGFSPDEKSLYSAAITSGPIGAPTVYGIDLLDVQTGQKVVTFADAAADMNFINSSANGRIFFDADRSNALGFWDAQTGERLASMRALQQGEWLVTTPAGYFDGSPRGWTQIAWRVPGQGLTTQPAEIFFNEFYRPGLLAELLQGRIPTAPRTIKQVDRRQPSVSILSPHTKIAGRIANVSVTVQAAPPDAERKEPSGVRDIRLFRNGTLVKIWRGDIKLDAGKATFDAAVPVANGSNQFVAYAFNGDNVKSADAQLNVESIAPKRPDTAYILTVGINEYANPEFNLKFAVPDAETLGAGLAESQRHLGAYQNVVPVKLLNQEATKANISLALALLAGEHRGDIPTAAPKQLQQLKAAQPEDAVVIYFAGHGVAWDDRFYLIPHDLGYMGPRSQLPASLETVLEHGISDRDLESAFEPMQAGHSLLIIDACNSGKALDSEEQRRGPMNNRGLAQLAYEKGMYILTAAQSYQAALESARLGHGYLTFALAEEGLKTALADTQPTDGRVTAAEWFEYASRRVPELQMEALRQAEIAGRQLTFDVPSATKNLESGGLQTPRFYYRRDLSGSETIIAAYTK